MPADVRGSASSTLLRQRIDQEPRRLGPAVGERLAEARHGLAPRSGRRDRRAGRA